MSLLAAMIGVACSSGEAAPDAAPEVVPRVESGERLVTGEGFRVIVPSSWKDLPDMRPAAAAGSGTTAAVGDPREAVFLTVLETVAPGQADGRTAGRLFLAELEKQLAESGAKVSRWDIEDTSTGVRARTTVERGEMRAEGLRLGLLDAKGDLHGWSVDCLSRAASPAPACQHVLGSFEVLR